jgi:hypothetical protein
MKNIRFSIILSFFLSIVLQAQTNSESIIWPIDNLSQIGGHSTETIGDPVVVNGDLGHAVQFDGVDDGLIVENNPVAGATEFTIEVVFQPYASTDPGNVEQRFIHMQENDDHRLLIELRLTDDNQWFLDTFIKSDKSSKVLFAEDFPHPIGPWYHAALVYKEGEMRHYVNGELELTGNVSYIPVSSGQTSVGVRLNKRSWYKGAIHKLKVTHRALEPGEFLTTGIERSVGKSSPRGFSLQQNIPNPFNGSTSIHYSVMEQNHVKLFVYNLLGQQVVELQNGVQPASNYSINFDGTSLQSGTYLYRLRIGSGSAITKKMTLLK